MFPEKSGEVRFPEKSGEVWFRSSLLLLSRFPGKFGLYWQVPGGNKEIPLDSQECPYIPYSDCKSYELARILPGATLGLWWHNGNLGVMQKLFDSQLPTKAEFETYKNIVTTGDRFE